MRRAPAAAAAPHGGAAAAPTDNPGDTPAPPPTAVDDEMASLAGRTLTLLLTAPAVLALASFMDPTGALDEEGAPVVAPLWLWLVQVVSPVLLTCGAFYPFWELLRRKFVPRLLMPSTITNPQLFAQRQEVERIVTEYVNKSPHRGGMPLRELDDLPRTGWYARQLLELPDPHGGGGSSGGGGVTVKLECGVWENREAMARSSSASSSDGGAGGDNNTNNPGGHKWVLYLNANGVAYQDILPFTIKYANALKASVINLNYRGVQGSTGETTGETTLLADAERALLCVPKVGVAVRD
jgi:hypothetical protein